MTQLTEATGTARVVNVPAITETLEKFRDDEEGRGVGAPTADKYVRNVRHFAVYLGDGVTIAQVTKATILAYRTALLKKQKLAATSINQHLSAIRAYIGWCIDREYRIDDPTTRIAWLKTPKPLPRALSADELDQVLAAANTPVPEGATIFQRHLWRRHCLAVKFMLYTGARLNEAALVRWSDVSKIREAIRHGRSAPSSVYRATMK